MHVETREVFAEAYPRGHVGAMLSHACIVDGVTGAVYKVLCGGAKPESMADAGSMSAGGKHEPPTCPRCLTKMQAAARVTPRAGGK